MTIADVTILSTGDLVRHFAVPESAIRKAMDEERIGRRVGRYRVVCDGDLPAVETALIVRGYLKPSGREAVSC